jgi:phytoene dehydrogenase-like protein
MAEPERYDALIIGSGEAGKHIGWTMAQMGHRTAVVERKLIGGLPAQQEHRPQRKSGIVRSSRG